MRLVTVMLLALFVGGANALTLRGTVVAEDGRPVVGADIWLCVGPAGWLGCSQAQAAAQTDESGQYELETIDVAVKRKPVGYGYDAHTTKKFYKVFDLRGRRMGTRFLSTPNSGKPEVMMIPGVCSRAMYVRVVDPGANRTILASREEMAKTVAVSAKLVVSAIGYTTLTHELDGADLSTLDGRTDTLNEAAFSVEVGLLNSAYRVDSPELLDEFLMDRVEDHGPISDDELAVLDDTLLNVYDIFREFYSPDTLARLTQNMFEYGQPEFRFAVVQNTVQYQVVGNDISGEQEFVQSAKKSIHDFYPRVNLDPSAVIYNSMLFESVLQNFLMVEPDNERPDAGDRVTFLSASLFLYHHHWQRGWGHVTGPAVSLISINRTMNRARVDFSLVYQGGHAILEKRDGVWVLVESLLTWIT